MTSGHFGGCDHECVSGTGGRVLLAAPRGGKRYREYADHANALARLVLHDGVTPTESLERNLGDFRESLGFLSSSGLIDTMHRASEEILAIHTPGHTSGSTSYLWRNHVLTGDTLLIDGCGRTDFQSGDAGSLYDSVHERLFTLPDETRVWPAHDYNGNTVSTIGHEKRHNARLSGRDRPAFIELMASLKLPRPKLMDVAVPANLLLGIPHAA